jgi:hypothetical protein
VLLQLPDGGLELGDGGADVRKLDDVGLRRHGELPHLREVIGPFLLLGQLFGKVGQDPARQGDVPRFDGNAAALRERPDDREEGIGSERGGFIDLGPDDLGWLGRHVLSLWSGRWMPQAIPAGHFLWRRKATVSEAVGSHSVR